MLETLLSAFALVLVIEGVMPLLGPRQWRRVFERVLAMQDGQLRFIGLTSVLAGVLMLVVLG